MDTNALTKAIVANLTGALKSMAHSLNDKHSSVDDLLHLLQIEVPRLVDEAITDYLDAPYREDVSLAQYRARILVWHDARSAKLEVQADAVKLALDGWGHPPLMDRDALDMACKAAATAVADGDCNVLSTTADGADEMTVVFTDGEVVSPQRFCLQCGHLFEDDGTNHQGFCSDLCETQFDKEYAGPTHDHGCSTILDVDADCDCSRSVDEEV